MGNLRMAGIFSVQFIYLANFKILNCLRCFTEAEPNPQVRKKTLPFSK